MDFLIKEQHKVYNYADEPSVERRVYWLFTKNEKRNLIVEVEHYNNGHIYNFFVEDEKFSDHYLVKNMKKIAGISSLKQIDEEEVIRRILNSKIEGIMKEQYLKEIEEEVYVWIKTVEGLNLSDLKDNLV